jgi:hypothetical protein
VPLPDAADVDCTSERAARGAAVAMTRLRGRMMLDKSVN